MFTVRLLGRVAAVARIVLAAIEPNNYDTATCRALTVLVRC